MIAVLMVTVIPNVLCSHTPFIIVQARNAPLPILPSTDPVDRNIEFMPTRLSYDPRWMIEGRQNPGSALIYLEE